MPASRRILRWGDQISDLECAVGKVEPVVASFEPIAPIPSRMASRLEYVGMRIPNYRGTSRVTINMTPMIDVTFLLIIFFLVSSHLAKQENFLPLELPSATAGIADLSDRPTLTIQIPKDGLYQHNGTTLDLDQVRMLILGRMQADGGQPLRIRIRTDQSVPYAAIAHLLKTCALTGNSDIVFAVYEGG